MLPPRLLVVLFEAALCCCLPLASARMRMPENLCGLPVLRVNEELVFRKQIRETPSYAIVEEKYLTSDRWIVLFTHTRGVDPIHSMAASFPSPTGASWQHEKHHDNMSVAEHIKNIPQKYLVSKKFSLQATPLDVRCEDAAGLERRYFVVELRPTYMYEAEQDYEIVFSAELLELSGWRLAWLATRVIVALGLVLWASLSIRRWLLSGALIRWADSSLPPEAHKSSSSSSGVGGDEGAPTAPAKKIK
eukprot:GHVU01118131.1.p1 GENE.GHVU01118131.1~~GHVU01118131.1.p1  ORF type:complete len:247 (+),score=29.09 GHVU01118131.1:148-888(+)